MIPQSQPDRGSTPSSPSVTWRLRHKDLEETLDYAWESLNPQTNDILANVEALPNLSNAALPYCDGHGEDNSQLAEIIVSHATSNSNR